MVFKKWELNFLSHIKRKMIPLIDLTNDNKLTNEIKTAVDEVIDSKNYILGKRLENFEKKFGEFIGSNDAIGVGSGTDALRLCLRSMGVGFGDKVLTVGFTSPFTVIAIVEEGAIPVFCDINEDTLTLDVRSIEGKLDKRVKAIIPVHIYGNPCDMEAILKFAKKHKLAVIEDACQAVGASLNAKMAGTLAAAAAFSFYPTKNLGGMGDGGMVTTNRKNISKTIRNLRHGGQTKRFWHEYNGINSRLDEMQAAILNVKLKYLKTNNRKRAMIAQRYIQELSDLPIRFQSVQKGANSCWHLFVIFTPLRDKLKKYLAKKGVIADVYYPHPVYAQKAFSVFPKYETPVTDRLCREVLALPIFPNLSPEDQEIIIKAIRNFFNKS